MGVDVIDRCVFGEVYGFGDERGVSKMCDELMVG